MLNRTRICSTFLYCYRKFSRIIFKKVNSDKILRWTFVVRILIDQVIVTSVFKGVVLHLNNLEFPPPKDALCKFG